MTRQKQYIRFWNGNKSSARRDHERRLLVLCLDEAELRDVELKVDENDYPDAQDEGNIFTTACDVLVSVAGNQKFSGKPSIVSEIPVCSGILGQRLLLIPQHSAERFASLQSIKELQQMKIGIPATWADADLFRHNGFNVSEKGTLDDLFGRLLDKECDYIALGANEIEAIIDQFSIARQHLMIEPNTLIYYPLPLVFYVHPQRPDLLDSIETGLKRALANGKHQALFDICYPNLAQRLGLRKRKTFRLTNPNLPITLHDFYPSL